MCPRCAELHRQTRETTVDVKIGLDPEVAATTANSVDTGLPFFDHMLDALSHHGKIALQLKAVGDLQVDPHHTMEDCGLSLGQVLRQALGEKRGITRFGAGFVPLDEALARVVIDLSGRPYLAWRCQFPEATAGGINVRIFHEFFQALANAAAITIHVDLLAGDENHHCLEAIFKATGRALRQAVAIDPSLAGATPSTKGMLE